MPDVISPGSNREFVEPTRGVQLAWGTYDIRYGLALVALVLGPLVIMTGVISENNGGPTLASPFTVIGALVFAASWILLPAQPVRRLAAGLMSTAALLLVDLLSFLSSGAFHAVLQLIAGVAAVVVLTGWLIARERPRTAFAGLAAVALVALALALISTATVGTADGGLSGEFRLGDYQSTRAAEVLFLILGGIAAVAIGAWVSRAIAVARPGSSIEERATHRSPVAAAATSERTNTFAILALVFGLSGGLLGIVFGHLALAQIQRTGEQGRPLAIIGLVFGYVAVGAVLAVVIAALIISLVT